MVKPAGLCLLAGWAMVLATGCTQMAITGEAGRHEQVIHGNVGITGEKHELTILSGSDVAKLSIIGEDNRVVVEDGAVLRKVEIIGEDNEVICPPGLTVQYSGIGEGNRLKHRQ
ncbi:MAG: hypothetical protein V2A79_04760 [Planctomycetota bacterium]